MSESNVKYTEAEALDFHSRGRPGKVEIIATKPMATQRDLALAYSPGVAVPVRAIANNPIPLTEEAVLRPDPTFVYARQLATAEALVEEWRTTRPGRRTAVLRPAIPLAADGTSSLARALTAGLGHRFGEDDPGAQFVHHDDIASAVALLGVEMLDEKLRERSGYSGSFRAIPPFVGPSGEIKTKYSDHSRSS